MALSDLTNGGSNFTVAGLTATVQPSNNMAVGATAVVIVTADNAGSGGVTGNITTCTDNKGNVYTRQQNNVYDPGVASAGVEIAIFTSVLTVALLFSDTITVNFGLSTGSRCIHLRSITSSLGGTATYVTGAVGAGGATGAPTITTSSIASGDMVIGVCGYESNVFRTADDTDTLNGSWSASQNQVANTGTVATSMGLMVQTKVVTAAGAQTYDFTLTSCDTLMAWISLTEALSIAAKQTFVRQAVQRAAVR